MSEMNIAVEAALPRQGARASGMNRADLVWMLGLYGTAIGAGTLFLPINAGVGGLWPLLAMTLLALPLTFFAHRGLNRFVLSGSTREGDITEVVEEHFGKTAGKLITLLYFFAIYPILLMYAVAITNTVESLMVHQLGMTPPPRALLALGLILALMAVVRLGGHFIVKAMSVLVFPFVIALMGLALYLVPHWNGAIISEAPPLSEAFGGDFIKTLWLAIPVMVFSFNHSPIISSFAVDNKRRYGERADGKCNRILLGSHIMMVVSVLFFVFSCVLALSPADLLAAKEQNISILSYLANHFDNPVIATLAPLIAMVAISKSFLGHYLGAKEGFNGLMVKTLRERGKRLEVAQLDRITALFMILTTWAVATINPSILGMIESLGGPIIAMLLFLMPMYAIRKVPAMARFAGQPSNLFVTLIGVLAMTGILYSLLF
ncbi:HAAAP family serine/threonine permease [Aeromonas bivalvium]|uniref:HAAAP family serine/threonine permease n=1 Tax=Aeromonas bivalvium TaxID=440079 RepID=UPI0013A70162|nr:HAAAP family serine/threonine permease [Aeromonas bivalvium]